VPENQTEILMKKKMFLGKWLLIFVFLIAFSPLTNGRGSGSGGGGSGGKKSPGSCEVAVPTRIDLSFPSASSIPGRDLNNCKNLPKQGSNPMFDVGGEDLSDNQRFFCQVIIQSPDNCFYREYKWTTPTEFLPVETPRNRDFTVTVEYYEACSNCTPAVHNSRVRLFSQKFYRNRTGSQAGGVIVAELQFLQYVTCL
jgi:hypothetical protein